MGTGSPSTADPGSGAAPIGEAVLLAIEEHLRDREQRREALYQQARRLRRLSQATVSRLHTDRTAPGELADLRRSLAELAGVIRRDGRADEPVALDAFQEAVEACLLAAILDRSSLPTPAELGVEPEPYLLGLGDVVGEVRRLVLDRLGREDLPGAETLLLLMERLAEMLMRFDASRAIVQLKPKQDQARILLERTRGEVVMARLLLRARTSAPESRG
jgi:translin